jgi:hypothetical protein
MYFKVLKIILIFLSFFILPTRSFAFRPFITEDANTAQQFQLDTAFWLNALKTNNNSSLSQFTYVGIGLTDWLEVAGASGSGYDFSENERTSSNPTLKKYSLFIFKGLN